MSYFQDFRLLNHLSAFDNVALPLRVAGVREVEVEKNVTELLSWVGLKEHLQASPPTLSGGQQQRVAIARAVIARPKLLLADEPTGNVDDNMALRLMHLFAQLNKLGTTIVIATHNEAMAERLVYPCLQLEDGTLHVSEAAKQPTEAEDFDHENPYVLTALPDSARRRSEELP